MPTAQTLPGERARIEVSSGDLSWPAGGSSLATEVLAQRLPFQCATLLGLIAQTL